MNDSTQLERYEPQEPEQSALVPYHPMPPPTLFGTSDPAEVIAKATAVASALKDVLKRQGLISNIQGKEYPKCEAWTLLGTILGVFPVLQWTKDLENGYEARVEAKTKDGAVVGAAEAICTRAEKNWSNRDDFALKSMAQTRATAKALRMPLGFVMTLAGYQATPAEEMDFERDSKSNRGTNVPQTGNSQGKQRETTGKSQGTSAPATQSTAKPPAPAQATEEQRLRFIAELKRRGEWALGYCYDKGWLLPPTGKDDDWTPGEPLECLGLERVPVMASQAKAILAELDALLPEGYKLPQPESDDGDLGPQTGKAVKHSEPDQQAWFSAIVPVPYAGMKRDEYLKKPDTIGELYNLRHDDEQARKRLFGFLYNFEPKGWKNREGKQMPPSKSDVQFRADLDLFGVWFEANHPDEAKSD